MSTVATTSDWSNILIVFGIIAFVFVSGLYYFFSKQFKLAKASANWSPTDAVVIKSGLRAGKNGGPVTPNIVYEYTVNGNKYSNNWFIVGNIFNQTFNNKEQKSVVAKYPVDSKISVFYDPDNPQHAVIVPGWQPMHATFRTILWLILTFDFLLFILGIVLHFIL